MMGGQGEKNREKGGEGVAGGNERAWLQSFFPNLSVWSPPS